MSLSHCFTLLACALAWSLVTACTPTHAEVYAATPAWTTYHHDAARSGYDPEALEPVPPTEAWQSPDLGAPLWNQPLVLGAHVYVATVGDEIYALDSSTGEIEWRKSVGTPVPSTELPCGDVFPTVGIVGTPVIDPTSKVIYAVADTWNAETKEAHHLLKGLSLADGAEVLSTPVDPPGADPKAILQRTALNLDAGMVLFGFGGNNGDCGEYKGAVVAVPEDGDPARFWQYQPAAPSSAGGAVWATSGPTVDGEGHVYATTGNPNPSEPTVHPATVYDYSDSVVELDLAQDFVALPGVEPSSPLGWFEPPNWEEESNNDLDLSSAGAELLPGGVLFQAGKDGVGYLIDESTMSTGAPAVDHHEVCGGHGSFGGDAYADGTLYIPCTTGIQALAYNQGERTFLPLWRGPADAFGPPIVSNGLVWSLATGGFNGGGTKLYGLDPASGETRYSETLPSPIVDHFASPSAAAGRLFLASGSSVTAYRIARLSPDEGSTCAKAPCPGGLSEEGETPGAESTSPSGSHSSSSPSSGSSSSSPAPTTTLPRAFRPASGSNPLGRTPALLHSSLRTTTHGRLLLTLRCPALADPCRGTVILRAKILVQGHRHRRLVLIPLTRRRFGSAKGDFTVALHLNASARAHLLRHHGRLALQVTIVSPGGGTRRIPASLLYTA